MKKSTFFLLCMTATMLTFGFSACSKSSEGAEQKEPKEQKEQTYNEEQILNGLALADESLRSSITASETRNGRLYQDFESALMSNPAKIQEWYDYAMKVKWKADELYNYIQNFKNDLVRLADGSRTDVAGEYAVAGGHGRELRNNIDAYCQFITSLINDRDGALSNTIQATLTTKNIEGEEWENALFDGMPVEAAVMVLTKIQNDVRSTEGLMIQYLMNQTDAGSIRTNKYNAYVIPNSNHVIRGDKYQARIIVAAVDTTQHPDFFVDGVQINSNGLYEVNTSGIGMKRYSGYISFDQNGDNVQLPFTGEYMVCEPTMTISNNDLNIMYRGYDNKFSISVPGVPNERVRVSASGAKVCQRNQDWIINPNDGVKTVTIKVSAELDGKMQSIGSKEFRVKSLPTPTAYFTVNEKEYASGSKIALSLLKNPSASIVASYGSDGLLNIPFKVTSFTTIINGTMLSSQGDKLSKEQLEQIAKQKMGQVVIFENIRALAPGGQELHLSPLTLTIQ